MSGVVSHWPVLLSGEVGDDELDADLRLTPAAVRRLGDAAVEALVALAPRLGATERRSAPTGAQLNGAFPGPGAVSVSASAAEILPTAVEVAVRIRPTDGSSSSVDAVWTITVPGGVTTAVRDELIALVHAARLAH